MWPFNYPGDEYTTNLFSQVIVIVEEIKETTIEFINEIAEELKNE